MKIREMSPADIHTWSDMPSLLWPEYDEDHKPEFEKYLSGKSLDVTQAFIVEVDEVVAGFIELNVRNFAEGSCESAVPYVEAWLVKSEYRGIGLGISLVSCAESRAMEQGYSELASDTDQFNSYSIKQHLKLGFKETGRIVCFLKKLRKI